MIGTPPRPTHFLLWFLMCAVCGSLLYTHHRLMSRNALQQLDRQLAKTTAQHVIVFRSLQLSTPDAERLMEWVKARESMGHRVVAFTSQPYDEYEDFRHTHQLAVPFHTLDYRVVHALAASGWAVYSRNLGSAQWEKQTLPNEPSAR